jgi:hypothetical protein
MRKSNSPLVSCVYNRMETLHLFVSLTIKTTGIGRTWVDSELNTFGALRWCLDHKNTIQDWLERANTSSEMSFRYDPRLEHHHHLW